MTISVLRVGAGHWYVYIPPDSRSPIHFYVGYIGNTILRTLLGRVGRTGFCITLGVRDEAIGDRFRKDGAKVRIIDLDNSTALKQAGKDLDDQPIGLGP